MFPSLTPVTPSDHRLLLEIYVSGRADEMSRVPWPEQVKQAFLESQFEAQNRYYFSKYPDGSFNLIKVENQTAGRLYAAELADEIRIIDITLLPHFRGRGIGTFLISKILEDGLNREKPVSIYLETFNRSQDLFSRLGFQPVSDDGVYCLWEKKPEETFHKAGERAGSASPAGSI